MKPTTSPVANERLEPDLAPSPSTFQTRSPELVHAVCTEVYRLTGKTLTEDDPILIAALFQSELIRTASQDMAHRLEQATSHQISQITEALRQGREQASQLDQVVAQAFQQIAEGARKVSDAELTELQARFARLAAATLDQVRRQSQQARPAKLRWKFALCVAGGLCGGLLGGTWLARHTSPQLNAEQVRLMANGMLLDDAWPRLPRASRELFNLGSKSDTTAAPAASKLPAK